MPLEPANSGPEVGADTPADLALMLRVAECLAGAPADRAMGTALANFAAAFGAAALALWRRSEAGGRGLLFDGKDCAPLRADPASIENLCASIPDQRPIEVGSDAATCLLRGVDANIPAVVFAVSGPKGEAFVIAAAGISAASVEERFEAIRSTADLLCAALAQELEERNREREIAELDRIINFSDSIYASWHEEEGWHYHNVKVLLQLGHRLEDISLSRVEGHNPMHPEDWQEAMRLFQIAVREGKGYPQEYRALAANEQDDVARWYRADLTVTGKNARGGARELVTISRDISRMKRAEDEAVQAARLEKWLVARTKAIFNCYDFSALSRVLEDVGHFLDIDRCTLRVIDPDMQATHLATEWHRPGLSAIEQLLPSTTETNNVDWVRRLRRDGKSWTVGDTEAETLEDWQRRYFRAVDTRACIVQPMIHGDALSGSLSFLSGSPRRWSATELRVARELAELIHLVILRNRLLDEIRATDQRFQLAMESATYGFWEMNVRAGTIYYSPQFYERLGYPVREEPIPVAEMVNYIHREDLALVAQAPASDNFVDLELRHIRRDGGWVWILARGKILERDAEGEPLRVIGVNLDISEQMAAQAGLRQARELAEEANRTKSEFLERMSHEIRTPMNAIVGMSYLALQSELDLQQRNYLQDIDGATASLLHIIDDILDFSKIESGQLAVVPRRFDLRGELLRLVKMFSPRAQQAGNTLSLEMAAQVPTFVVGDKNRLGQILSNLLGNAVKFTSKGKIHLQVRCIDNGERINSVTLSFAVRDTGIGLSEQQIESIFEPFVQAEGSTSRKYGGTGLGLSICKHLVEMMGGSIQCSSSPQQGTTFEFTVVLKRHSHEEDEHSNVESVKAAEPSRKSRLEGRRVLLAEDNPINRQVASGILKRFGVEAVSAHNGAEAIALLEAQEDGSFDAVLMDIEMPVMDGLSATRLLRRHPRFATLPVVAMTAHAMLGDRERCLAAGMDDYIPKPVRPEMLREVLARVLRQNDAGEVAGS